MSSGFLKTYFHVMTQSYMETINLLFFFWFNRYFYSKDFGTKRAGYQFKSSLLWRCKYDIYIYLYTHTHTLFFWNVWLYIYATTYISVVLGNVKQKFHWTKLDRPGKLFKLLQWGKEMELNSAERKIRRVFKSWWWASRKYERTVVEIRSVWCVENTELFLSLQTIFSVISLLGLLVAAVTQAPPFPQRRAHRVLSPCMFTCQKQGYLVFKKDVSCVLTLARGWEKVCTIPKRQRKNL